jgi:hypothetical protein
MIGLSATGFRKGVMPGFKFVGDPKHKTRTLDAVEYIEIDIVLSGSFFLLKISKDALIED